MSIVGEVADRADRPAYVRFERVAVEDKVASDAAGHYVARDVDFALVTPPYSKDIFKAKAAQWLENMRQEVRNGRIPQDWADHYEKAYKSWSNGQELPLNGTAIRGWGVISPAQQETLIRMNILTVEDLSRINDEGVRRIGMGASELKAKATAWLSQLKDKGPLTQEVAALKSENALLRANLESLEARVAALGAAAASVEPEIPGIGVDDIIPDDFEGPSIPSRQRKK